MKTTKLTIGKETINSFLKAIKELNDSDVITLKIIDKYETTFDNIRVEIEYTTESNLFYLGFLTQLYNNVTFCEQ